MGPRTKFDLNTKPTVLPYGKQSIDDADIAAVTEALRSDYLTTGPIVETFERALADFCGAKHAIAVSNGTAALHVAMLAAGIKSGDRVITSANTFLASANCAEFVGATADFADIDSRTYNVTPSTLQARWRDDVKAVVAVDFAGQPCDMPGIAELARDRGTIVIEDASHAIGSAFDRDGTTYKVGGHPWTDMTTFSFHPVKTITAGEGGAILTNDDRLAKQCRLFRNHGMVKSGGNGAPWYYEMHEVGYNYRITDLQCALGLSQLKKLDSFIKRRADIVAQYNAAFESLPNVVRPWEASQSRAAWHLYVMQFNFPGMGKTRTEVMAQLKSRGVGTQVHYIPVHLQPYYRRKYGYAPGKCPISESYYQGCLSLPLYPALSDAQVLSVIAAVQEVVGS